ncbi:hypothetical protein [Leminorella grimontii]|uniref:hypothetical protein n=1 Tax=Leminorella grimontii TaxID=82981 RepID=UPI002086936E|nr:hypothetical protein [Leminorella grimontii]GKX60658.1 hypothetical protein SOASR031_29730 [Leminorella grimontii]
MTIYNTGNPCPSGNFYREDIYFSPCDCNKKKQGKVISVESRKANNVSITTVNLNGLTAEFRQANSIKKLTVSGRGNVRQIKAIAKEFHRAITE